MFLTTCNKLQQKFGNEGNIERFEEICKKQIQLDKESDENKAVIEVQA